MKKKIFFIIVLLILILFIILKYENYYSLDEVNKILNSAELPENVFIENEVFDSSNTKVGIAKFYKKKDILYVYQENNEKNKIETLYDYEKLEKNTINHFSKYILKSKIENVKFEPLGLDTFNALLNSKYQSLKYAYHGSLVINNKKQIKISFTINTIDSIEKIFFYINTDNKLIEKIEVYKGRNINEMEISTIETYTYKFNYVKDEDILNFDVNKYKEYNILNS